MGGLRFDSLRGLFVASNRVFLVTIGKRILASCLRLNGEKLYNI